ncbi:hypothetical protein Molly5_36 [Maribacter phage Molly_5]|uniref:Uncharacterized protein n=2 Tax=Mollyvirus TaxID=2948826 RepID=A0A8E4XY03_9CAUD|nr:hypothetical protein M1M29_gp036 [Maribacter phage Molly_1]YP_010357284.1 hypothetical protein M1M30_gp035 [Maribacter phage Colly_1]QQO97718.1 hypothetical protein Molly2_36 [Maribacter phage Molly_2]QQO97918.1 hypothetical protein Molly3_36 [Maribacter phage Molly_3]QQO98118.1 hypothetical protein Molly4_36 [Maribacter phage Molly_4]QQO98318.1 hypothetical protein Molly5_36 [Maribacter phage Molly_5]QQO97317.1 hypothetical protein Colly1_35 [Maribacter phage Colly_1]
MDENLKKLVSDVKPPLHLVEAKSETNKEGVYCEFVSLHALTRPARREFLHNNYIEAQAIMELEGKSYLVINQETKKGKHRSTSKSSYAIGDKTDHGIITRIEFNRVPQRKGVKDVIFGFLYFIK